jgi:hypothetical protein
MKSTSPKFETWLQQHGYDQQRWNPELLASLRDRYRRENPAMILVDCRGCDWPQRVYRVQDGVTL